VKVLLVQKMAGISGSERYFLTLLPALRAKGVDARFLVVQHPANAGRNAPFIDELKGKGIPVYVFDSRLPISLGLVRRLARLVREQGIDLLQTNLIHADVWGACAKLLFDRRMRIVSVKHGYTDVYQARHGLDPAHLSTDRMSLLTRWSARRIDRVVCISQALETFFVRGGLIDAAKTTSIPYGSDFSTIDTEVAEGGLRFGMPQIVVAGRLVQVKQHHLLLGILPHLVQDFPQLSVVMVGAGPLLETLVQRTRELGLSGHVRWEGFRANMHDYIRDSDVMVLPSSAEGFGLVVLEAWYHGKPVVAFDVPALNEIIESGVDGILVRPFDTESLLAELRSLLASADAMRDLGEAGRAKQRRLYDVEAMTERTIGVYRDVIAATSSAREPAGQRHG
jgi:glycosyltransferase involved in cell wall biosynthesis